jgi:LacI family transcriptional regulator
VRAARLAYLGRGGVSFSDRERQAGFAAAAGGAVMVAHAAGRGIGEATTAATALLAGSERPDGIFCHNDLIAIGALEAARALGLAVPGDVSIVGFNDIALAASRSFRLTTIALSVPALVEGVLSLLDRRLAQPGAAGAALRIPVQPKIRATTREFAPA